MRTSLTRRLLGAAVAVTALATAAGLTLASGASAAPSKAPPSKTQSKAPGKTSVKPAYNEPCFGCTLVGTGDYTGDGNPDLLVRENGTGTIYAYPGSRGPFQQAPIRVGTGFGGATFVGVADWDRDGKADIIYRVDGGPDAGSLYAYDDTKGPRIGTGFGGASFAGIYDWDNNGKLDVIYRLDSTGTIHAYDDTKKQVGTGFGGVTFAGVGKRYGVPGIYFRLDQTGELFAYTSHAEYIGYGWHGADFAGLADWDMDSSVDIIYRVNDEVWKYGTNKMLLGNWIFS